MSLFSALSGEIYRTRTPFVLLPSPLGVGPASRAGLLVPLGSRHLPAGAGSGVSGCRHRPSRQAREAASVLPDAVGARTSVSCPAVIAGQPCRCACVGSPQVERDPSRTGGKKSSTGEGASIAI